MSKLEFRYPKGATPIDPNELSGLIPQSATTIAELNGLERDNILEASQWAFKKKIDVLEIGNLFELHEKMFDHVWRWAGSARTSNKNIGVPRERIQSDLGNMCKNVRYWIEQSVYPFDEIAARFHHRLVQIHVFPNGNGRHARLATDLLLYYNDQSRFTWGSISAAHGLEVEGELRDTYIAALRAADQNDYKLLFQFVRS